MSLYVLSWDREPKRLIRQSLDGQQEFITLFAPRGGGLVLTVGGMELNTPVGAYVRVWVWGPGRYLVHGPGRLAFLVNWPTFQPIDLSEFAHLVQHHVYPDYFLTSRGPEPWVIVVIRLPDLAIVQEVELDSLPFDYGFFPGSQPDDPAGVWWDSGYSFTDLNGTGVESADRNYPMVRSVVGLGRPDPTADPRQYLSYVLADRYLGRVLEDRAFQSPGGQEHTIKSHLAIDGGAVWEDWDRQTRPVLTALLGHRLAQYVLWRSVPGAL